MIPTIANGQPAAVAYQRDQDGKLHAFGLGVLSVADVGIARIFAFGGGPELIATFGLPAGHHDPRGLHGSPVPTAEFPPPSSVKLIGQGEAHPARRVLRSLGV